MKKRTLFLIWLFALAVVPASLRAADAGQESVFSVGVGARALGMGGGFTALADDASALFYNPAGLGLLEYQELSFMHMSLFEGTDFNYAAWAYPLNNRVGVGLAFMRIGTNDIIRRQNFAPVGTFDFSQWQFLLSAGAQLDRSISVGATAKLAHQEIADMSDNTVGVDLGIMGQAHENVRVGVAFRDLVPPQFNLNGDDEGLPLTIAGSIAMYKYPLDKRVALTSSLELEKTENRSIKLHTGAEVEIDRAYFLRAGYDRDNLSFGAGYSYQKLRLDYAYKLMDHIDDSHRFSVSYLIGNATSAAIAEPTAGRTEEATGIIEDEFARQFAFYKDKADNFYNESELDSALVHYQRALAFESEHADIKKRINLIEDALEMQTEPDEYLEDKLSKRLELVDVYLDQIRSFENKRFYQAALDLLNQVKQIDPKNKDASKLREKIEKTIDSQVKKGMKSASDAEKRRDFAKAVEAYTRVLELAPDNQQARVNRNGLLRQLSVAGKLNLGINQYRQGRFAQARQQFETVLAADPTNAVAREYLSRIDETLTKPTTLEVLQADEEIWPLYLEGLRFMRDKKYEKAIDVWEKVLKVYPNSINTINNINQARLRLEAEKEN